MSLQWIIVAGCLYAEIALALLLSTPLASPSKWHKLFKSKFLKGIVKQLSKYFNIFIFVLVLLLCDSLRELRKYSELSAEERDRYANLDEELLISLRLCRAQRNLYLCGFTLVLGFVIRRMVMLISEQAELIETLKSGSSASGTKQTVREKKTEAMTSQSVTKEYNKLPTEQSGATITNARDKKLD